MGDINMTELSRYSQHDQNSNMADMVDEYGFSSSRSSIRKCAVYILVPLVVVAFILAIIAMIQVNNSDGLTQHDVFTEIASYFPSLVASGYGEFDVRLVSDGCSDAHCDVVNCEAKGALKTLPSKDGADLLCVCDGSQWQCDELGKFCQANPLLPSGAQFLPDVTCTNTPSSKTCPFKCSGSLVPSGEFTCTDGEWDKQYCECTAPGFESLLTQEGFLGVIHTEGCDLTKSGEVCDAWKCEGVLHKNHYVEVKCGTSEWDIDSEPCVCKSEVLFTTLAKNGVDYVDVTNCDNTPAGAQCDSRHWSCPHKLHQQGEFKCNEKDGSWHVVKDPCLCYASSDIPGFERGCGYLTVGQKCDYDSWKCDDALIPITSLECTSDGLKGECGCSLEELEDSNPPPSANADVTGCNKTPIDEMCTDWTCDEGFETNCCNSPTCTDTGAWIVESNMCGASDDISCDPAELDKYGPMSCTGEFEAFDMCSLTCGGSVFSCPVGVTPPCPAICQPDGSWVIPCVCNPSTLSKQVKGASSDAECEIGEKCDVSCEGANVVVQDVVCDPWIGFTGYCGCEGLGEVLGFDVPLAGFDPWACEGYEIGDTCTPADYCLEGFGPFPSVHQSRSKGYLGNLHCSPDIAWEFYNGTLLTESDVFSPLCGCSGANTCQTEINGSCSSSDGFVTPIGDVVCPTNVADPLEECGFECSSSLYNGAPLECTAESGLTCQTAGECNCCECNATACGQIHGQVLCGDLDCGAQVAYNSTSDCPSGTTYMGLCVVDEVGMNATTCYNCVCTASNCGNGEICLTSSCERSFGQCDYPDVVGGTCSSGQCTIV